jgi:hypothetical protein
MKTVENINRKNKKFIKKNLLITERKRKNKGEKLVQYGCS